MVGINSVVIGGHFGGGDHFNGGDNFGGGTIFLIFVIVCLSVANSVHLTM